MNKRRIDSFSLLFLFPPCKFNHCCASRISSRLLHSSSSYPANPLPPTAHGPPPEAPNPAIGQLEDRIARRRKQAELLKQGSALREVDRKPGSALKRRFWKDVKVVEVEDGLQIHLDTRPVRTPARKILVVPKTKPLLAAAIALEWDHLTSAQQALKPHLIPLTSLVARVQSIEEEATEKSSRIRDDIVDTLMRYLDTDTLLCWAPSRSLGDQLLGESSDQQNSQSLRDIQISTALPILEYLKTSVWPGVEFDPGTDSGAFVPNSQPKATKDVIRGWMTGLPAYELGALERAVLAGKGLLGAVRLVVEWSPNWRHLRLESETSASRFGVEEAAEAASLEVSWQTRMWGEVEDTHDVEREDLRRQLGSAVLLVCDARDT